MKSRDLLAANPWLRFWLVLALPACLMAAPGTGTRLTLTRGEVHRVAGVAEFKAALEAANRAKIAATLLLADGMYVLDVPALDPDSRRRAGNRRARGPLLETVSHPPAEHCGGAQLDGELRPGHRLRSGQCGGRSPGWNQPHPQQPGL